MRMIFVAAAGCALAVGAFASQPPALHDKAYYVENQNLRDRTLAWCHGDASRSRMFDCQNAEAAATAMIFSRVRRDPLSYMDSAAYWAQNPIARAGMGKICAERRAGTEPYWRYCGVAAQAQGWSHP